MNNFKKEENRKIGKNKNYKVRISGNSSEIRMLVIQPETIEAIDALRLRTNMFKT